MTKAYEVNGVTVSTLKEVAEALNVTRVSTKDIISGQYPDVYIVDSADVNPDTEALDIFTEGLEDAINEQDTEDAKAFVADHLEIIMVGDAPTGDLEVVADVDIETTVDTLPDTLTEFMDMGPDTKVLTNKEEVAEVLTNKEEVPTVEDTNMEELPTEDEVDEDIPLPTPEDVEDPTTDGYEDDLEYPEVGYFEDDKAMKKYIKKLSNMQLAEWLGLEGVEYKPNDHESINRMRMAMAIKGYHFPDLAPKAGKAKKKSKYADYTTEQLIEMALDNDIEVRDDKGDMRILRMYTIMALKAANLLA